MNFLDQLPAESDQLRDYQLAQLEDIRSAISRGARRILCQGATGMGKTHIFCVGALAAQRAGFRVLILATRTRLLRQIHQRLVHFKVEHGVIAAQLPELTHYGRGVQVASADTLYRRVFVDQKMPLPGADVVVFDEAHLAAAETRRRILDAYPDAILLGFSATPARRSGASLSELFDVLVLGPSVRELIDRGVLVRPRIFNQPVIESAELSAIERGADGDYASGSLSKVMGRPKLVGDIVQNWLRIAASKRTMVFAITKAHGEALAQEFLRAGVAAELLTDGDDEETREAVLERLELGTTLVVVNCFLLAYGVDVPSVEVVVLARPTRSIVMYLQSVGRGMRPAPGKDSLIVIDHGRVVENLGLPTGDFGWSLEEGSNVNRAASEQVRARIGSEEQARTCPECAHLWLVSEEGNACGLCGWQPKPAARAVPVEDAVLHELDTTNVVLPAHDPRVMGFFQESLDWYCARWPDRWQAKPNSARAYAWHAVREKFAISDMRIPGRYWGLPPLPTSQAVAGWLKHRLIRYAKRRSAA